MESESNEFDFLIICKTEKRVELNCAREKESEWV